MVINTAHFPGILPVLLTDRSQAIFEWFSRTAEKSDEPPANTEQRGGMGTANLAAQFPHEIYRMAADKNQILHPTLDCDELR